MYEALASIAFRCNSHDDPEVRQHSKVMGHEIASHPEQLSQLGGGPVGQVKGVDNSKSMWITQSRMEMGTVD